MSDSERVASACRPQAGQPRLAVDWVPTADLVPYAGNAKVHTDEQVDEICESIKQFGFSDPIGAWNNPKTGEYEVVEGHGRLMAAERLGMESVPVVRLDHMSDDERRAYAIAHNQLTMNTDFDAEALDAEVSAIAGIDMSAYGFEVPDIGDYGTDFELPDRDEPDVSTANFTLAPEQKRAVMDALATVDTGATETYGNEDPLGNALYQLFKEWSGEAEE